MVEIKDAHIREAEKFLIRGNGFDSHERVPFIKNLESCDLLAVPGSGKTTALLAKLYCLSKNLPFKEGCGILVLSHTNAAIEEIEKNLRKHSPSLFEYPNFVGTVQSFVNKFLANPACLNKYGSYIFNNDNDIYEKEAIKFFKSLRWKSDEPKGLKNKLYGRVNQGKNGISEDEKIRNIQDFLIYFELDFLKRKIKFNESFLYTFDGNSQAYYLELENWKESLLRKGILNYRDSFYLAEWFLNRYPSIKLLLQSRFKFVFIDEMQDLEKYQIDIIDEIFFGNNSSTIIQRIGDINQSIYNSGKRIKVNADWQPRNPMFLNGSNRLTPEIADVVNCFTLDRQHDEIGNPRFIVNGLRQLDTPIRPHLLLFNNQSSRQLESKFIELIKNYSLSKTREGHKYGFNIIGWNARWDDNEEHQGKLRLENIFESYKKEANGTKEVFDSLKKYLQFFNTDKNTLVAARKAILNALIAILRIEEKMISVEIRGRSANRFYSKSEMIKYIKSKFNNCDYELFKGKVYSWSFDLAVNRDYEKVYDSLKSFIMNDFKTWFELSMSLETINFIENQFEEDLSAESVNHTNRQEDDEIKVKIGTVHSNKGQTHCATMYVETSYFEYETQKARIKEALKKRDHDFVLTNDDNKRGKQALKMMYVGFSRPTHLLCFACLKENIVSEIEDYRTSGWEIIDLTVSN